MHRKLLTVLSISVVAILTLSACAPSADDTGGAAQPSTGEEAAGGEEVAGGEAAAGGEEATGGAEAAGGEEAAAPADMPEATGDSIVEYVTATNDYSAWGTWPTDEWNDFSNYLVSGEPHGNVVRIFVNDVALEAAADPAFAGALPAGSMIVKENYMSTDPAEPGDVAALTVMYKVDGFNPDANDWYWVKSAEGKSGVAKEGAVGGCIGCHGQANNHDYLLRYGFGEEPAVPGGQGS